MSTAREINFFYRIWFGCGLATVLLPLLVFTVARLSNAQDNNEYQNNNNNQNQNYNCQWYQWGCSNNNNNNNNNEQQQQDENSAPWWWLGGGERRPEDGPSPALVLAYVWSICLFAFILYVGYDGVRSGRDAAVIAGLFVLANLSFLMMILLQGAEGLVETEGRELEEHGFYGQLGVLMYMTYAMWLLFSIAFAIFIRRREVRMNVHKIEINPSDYLIHSERDTKVATTKSPDAVI